MGKEQQHNIDYSKFLSKSFDEDRRHFSFVITHKDMAPFADYKTADFEKWLRIGLEGYCLNERDSLKFEYIGYNFISDYRLSHEVIPNLKKVYNLFGDEKKKYFRQSVADLMDNLEVGEPNSCLFMSLLNLSSEIHVTEVLKVLPDRLEKEIASTDDKTKQEKLFVYAMMNVPSLVEPNQESLDCVNSLIDSKYFIDDFSGLALISLCCANPRGYNEHLERMRGGMGNIFKTFTKEQIPVIKNGYISDIMHWIGSEVDKDVLKNRLDIYFTDICKDFQN